MNPDQNADAQAGLDLCWSQTHYVGFFMARLKLFSSMSRDIYSGMPW
jgi:hypothetical protein